MAKHRDRSPPSAGDGSLALTSGSAGTLTRSDARVADLFKPLGLSAEQVRQFRAAPGSATEPWDVLLQVLAIDEHAALERFGEATGLEFSSDPRPEESAAKFYEVIPQDAARAYHIGGIASEHGVMVVATCQPLQPGVFRLVEERLEMPIRVVLTTRSGLANLVNRGYEQKGDLVTEIIDELPLDEQAISTAAGAIGAGNDLLALARQTPVIRLVNMILFEALRRRASDIHVHPGEQRLVIRFRIDGMLHDAFTPPLSLASAISSRLKVMTELDIANRHSPQDGQTTVRIGQKRVDIRMSIIPSIHGERIVLRLLDQTQTQLSLDAVGMSKKMQAQLMDLIERPNGMVLVTGPTGSGKTTTLYAALGRIDRMHRNVMTIEDPVEYRLDGISQMQVNPKRNVTFATGLRALLRQDPDVILVGEIRDAETASLAVQASLTGHLVLATLHTNDAPGAIPRLIDVGMEPYLVTSSLLGVLAQRLVRRKCAPCGGMGKVADGARCESCLGLGYRGRLAVYEILTMNDELRRLTAAQTDGVTLRQAAIDTGFKTMRDDAMDKVRAGLTDESEVFRVLQTG